MSERRNTLTELVGNLLTGADDTGCSDDLTVVMKDAVDDLAEHIKFLNHSDESTILELARMALADANIYDTFANQLDLSDEYLKELQAKLETITGGVDFLD